MNEIPFFFPNGDYHLFGVMHMPAASRRNTAFVFCSPFGEEKLWTHLVYVNFARELASHGYPVLRFDFRGTGDSEGNFEDSTLETYLSDIRCAIEKLNERLGPVSGVGLLGLRFGATLAALTAEEVPEIVRLILWSPIFSGAYMQDLLRVNLSTQMALYKKIKKNRDVLIKEMMEGQTVNVDGYEITAEMYEQVSRIDLLAKSKSSNAQCLIVQIASSHQQVLKQELSLLSSLYRNGHVLLTKEEPFWKEINTFYARAERLYQDTLNWLESN